MRFQDIWLTVSLGFVIGLVYSEILSSAIVGDYTFTVMNLMYLTCCVLYPMYGYVPETSANFALLLFSGVVICVFFLPMLTVLLIGALVSVRSFETAFQPISVYPNRFISFPLLSGFILATQYGDADYLKFFILLIPAFLAVSHIVSRNFTEPDNTDDSPLIHTREELLGVRFGKTRMEPQTRTRGG
jgi:hypothetical protein